MTTFYATDSMGFFSGEVEVDEFSARVKGSFQPPPETPEGEVAWLSPAGWAVITKEAADLIRKKAMVPASLTPRQFRQALTLAGLREVVETFKQGASQDIKDWYDFADDFRPTHPLLQSIAADIGKTQSDIDDLFILGGSL